jgi:uncharacterized protein
MLRIVLDTNVLVSATVFSGKPRELVTLATKGRFVLIASEEIVDEFTDVIGRSKFKKTPSEIRTARNVLIRTAKLYKLRSKRKVVKEDPDDDVVINTALDGRAEYIVSGDPHLIRLSVYKGIKIVGVADMLLKLG